MFLKYNISNSKKEQRKLDLSTLEYKDNKIIITTSLNHYLNIGDSIDISVSNTSFNETLHVVSIESSTKFSVSYSPKKTIYLSDKIEKNDGGYRYKVKNELPFVVIGDKKEIILSHENNKFTCEYINEYYFDSTSDLNLDWLYIIEDNRLISNINSVQDIKIVESIIYVRFNVPLTSSYASELQDEDITKQFFEQRKKELIPEIVDYEKRCFSPYYITQYTDIEGNELVGYKPINSITFNLFLRDRSGSDNWTSNDTKYWNQYKDTSKIQNESFIIDNDFGADDLYDNKEFGITGIGFDEDDIKYQKKKLSKSFIRLSFYNSNNPLNQMLLFYSTIFFDTNVLFNNYINGRKTRASFTVYNRYNRDKSSEGFYLYLFPEYIGKTIYMKVEFNHAGYGRTIPLVYIKNGKLPISYMFKKENGKVITKNDLSDLYNDMYIPITIGYDEINNDYIYSYDVPIRTIGEKTVINLYEPKIN